MKVNLSRRQRQILYLMHKHGSAAFYGETRRFYWRAEAWGVIIQAYQQPEFFLKCRGLIEKVQANHPGNWRLTESGAAIAATITEMPRDARR